MKSAILILCLLAKDQYSQKISFELQTGHTGNVFALYLTPNNELLFSKASGESAVYVWQTSTGKKVKTIPEKGTFQQDIKGFLDSVGYLPEVTKREIDDALSKNAGKESVAIADTLFNVSKGYCTVNTNVRSGSSRDVKMLFDWLNHYNKVLLKDQHKQHLIFSDDKGRIVVANSKGKKLKGWKFGKAAITATFISNNKELLVVGNEHGKIYVLNLNTGKLVSSCESLTKTVERIYYSKDGNTIFTVSGNEIISYNYKTNLSKRLYMRQIMSFTSIDSTSGDSLVLFTYFKGSTDKMWGKWNVLKNTFVTQAVVYTTSAEFAKYSTSISQKTDSLGNLEVKHYSGTSFEITRNKVLLKTVLTGNSAPINSIKINRIYNYVSVAFKDGKISHYDLETGELLFSSIILNSNTYIHTLANGYYFGSKKIFTFLNCVQGSKILPHYQVDAEYNRPDRVIKCIPQHDSLFAAAIAHSYEKRQNKLSEQNGENSDITLLAEKTLGGKEEILLKINIFSKYSNVTKLSILVNGVDENIIIEQGKKELILSPNIKLSHGENIIEIFAQDESGGFSNKATFVENNKISEKPDLYLFCIGSAKFTDETKNLNYAAKDAQDVFELFAKQKFIGKKKYHKIYGKQYTNEQVNKNSVKEIAAVLSKANKNDVVILFYAGHGILNKDFDYYLSSYNVDFAKPEQNGIAYSEIENILQNCKARQKLFLIDACHSGDVEKGEMIKSNTAGIDTSGGLVFRSVTTHTNLSQNELSLLLSKELFASGSNHSGTSIIGASMGSQFAVESNKWNNGVFTHCLLKGVGGKKADLNHDDKIMLDELQYYVGKNVEELTSGKQKPSTRTENLISNMRVK